MATNVSITTFENCCVIYYDNGTTQVVNPHTEFFVQLGDMGFCTLSEAKDPDAAEHPPPDFVDAMVAFWTALANEIAESKEPEVNPL